MNETNLEKVNEEVVNEVISNPTGGNTLLKVGAALGVVAIIGGVVVLIKRRKKMKKMTAEYVECSEVEVEDNQEVEQ